MKKFNWKDFAWYAAPRAIVYAIFLPATVVMIEFMIRVHRHIHHCGLFR